jgi:hypothetical protein
MREERVDLKLEQIINREAEHDDLKNLKPGNVKNEQVFKGEAE